jgi:two-component system response regulator QseB
VVLIVEDDDRIASFVTRGLRAHGFQVEWVTTGEEAVARIEAGGVDVQILDLGLPDINGLEVLRRLGAAGASVPAVIVTARSDPRDRREALALGADHYLTKPFAWADLLAAVTACCGVTEA